MAERANASGCNPHNRVAANLPPARAQLHATHQGEDDANNQDDNG